MARFLIAVWPIPGHYYPNLSVADALRARGHEVVFLTGTRARPVVEAEGFNCFSFECLDERCMEQIFFAPQPRPRWWQSRLLIQRARYYAWLTDGLGDQAQDLERVIQQWRPDVLVCDPALWAAFLIFPEREQVPVAVFAYIPFCPLPGPKLPPLGFGLAPRPSGLARVRTGVARILFRLAAARFRRAANVLRRHYALAPIDVSVTEFSGRVPLYLVAGTREFDYGRCDLPPSVQYVGPCVGKRQRNGAPPTWFDALSREQPWVYLSEGTVHTQESVLLKAATRGLANMPVQVIIGTSVTDPMKLGLGAIAPNMLLEHWMNIYFTDLLPRTAVVITTGGGGTVVAALQAGVPLVVVPTEWDKPEIAQRVVQAGAGLRLAPRQCTPKRLRKAVERVLRDPAFRVRAQNLASDFAHHAGPARAAQLLEELSTTKHFESPRFVNHVSGAGGASRTDGRRGTPAK